MKAFLLAGLAFAALIATIESHGRLCEPAGRATLWRYWDRFGRFNPVPDYNDNQLFCGGRHTQYDEQNKGRCGICGDNWSDPEPREHEDGGIFGKGIITGVYTEGQAIDIDVELTAAHEGYFEFRLCPHDDQSVTVTQECLDRHVLELADGSGTKYPVPVRGTGHHLYKVVLPAGVRCQKCVLQWHYRTGNSHGQCDDGSWAKGCGDMETFRGCADITIN